MVRLCKISDELRPNRPMPRTASQPAPVRWVPAPPRCVLEPNQIHVWRVQLAVPRDELERLQAFLSPRDRQKAQRFAHDVHRHRYVVSHGALRAILGRYLDRDPAQLEFVYGPHGKPRLAAPNADSPLHFNLSHSGDLALVAVAADRELGVDLERLRADLAVLKLARRFFAPAEAAALARLAEDELIPAFCRMWVRKEALLKAFGEGISRNLARIEVDAEHHAGGCPFRLPDGLESAGQWELRELPPLDRYAAAVACAGHGWRLRCWDWN